MIINEINLKLIRNILIYLQTETIAPLKTLENNLYIPNLKKLWGKHIDKLAFIVKRLTIKQIDNDNEILNLEWKTKLTDK